MSYKIRYRATTETQTFLKLNFISLLCKGSGKVFRSWLGTSTMFRLLSLVHNSCSSSCYCPTNVKDKRYAHTSFSTNITGDMTTSLLLIPRCAKLSHTEHTNLQGRLGMGSLTSGHVSCHLITGDNSHSTGGHLTVSNLESTHTITLPDEQTVT